EPIRRDVAASADRAALSNRLPALAPRSRLALRSRLVAPPISPSSTDPLPLHDLRLQAPQVLLLDERAYDAESDERRIGVPPDALGPVGILDAPLGVRPAPRGAAKLVGIVVPRPTAHHIRVLLGIGQDDRS